MNMRQLEAFRATMRSGSITEAAEMMHLSQPSVSRLIIDLEHAVGFPLFIRSGRGLSPTVEAKKFYNGVEGMFIGIDRLQELANVIRSTSAVEINIGTIQSIAAVELPKAVNAIYQSMPETSFMIQSRNTPAILDAVQMNQIDIGVVGRAPPLAIFAEIRPKSVGADSTASRRTCPRQQTPQEAAESALGHAW